MTIFFTCNPSGVHGVAAALLPSVALSGGSWYIKRRFQDELKLLDEPDQTEENHEQPTNGGNKKPQQNGKESALESLTANSV